MSDMCDGRLPDGAIYDQWRAQDKIIAEVVDEVERLTIKQPANLIIHGLPAVPAETLLDFLAHRRIRLAVEYGRITPSKARELLGVPEWAR